MESYAIIFKRGPKNKKGEYKMIPSDYERGEVIIKEDGTRAFKIDDKEYRFSSDEKSLNDQVVISFDIPAEKLREALVNAGIEEEDSAQIEDYMEMLFAGYFDYMCSFNFYQKYDVLGRLKNYLVEKPTRQVHEYEEKEVLKDFIASELRSSEEAADKIAQVGSTDEEATKLKKGQIQNAKGNNSIDINNLYINVTSTVIGQNKQVKRIIGVISKNQIITNPKLKQNILVVGPTGTGKTEIFRQVAKELNLPITIEDSTKYTVTGYVGDDVDDMIVHLISNAGGDVKRAQKGIIVVDEIDKKADKEQGSKVATGGVLESLLKFMDGDVVKIKYGKQLIDFDTARLTIAAVGAFSGLDKTAKEPNPPGFGREPGKKLGIYSTENFNKFGILPEFIGRCKVKIMTNDLTEDDLVNIMLHSKGSPVDLNKEHFATNYGVDLFIADDAIREIAKASKELKTNARGLFAVIEEMLADADFEIQANPGVYERLDVGKETIYDNTKYELTRKKS